MVNNLNIIKINVKINHYLNIIIKSCTVNKILGALDNSILKHCLNFLCRIGSK